MGWNFSPGWDLTGMDNVGTRYRFGTKYSRWKGHELSVYIMHDRERNVAWPDHRWILSIDYSINLRRL